VIALLATSSQEQPQRCRAVASYQVDQETTVRVQPYRTLPPNGAFDPSPGSVTYQHGNTHLIEVRNVTKTFVLPAGAFSALRGVDLRIDVGEFVAIVGKSGSGKSTLINILTGIDRPSAGEIYVGDTALHTLDEENKAVWRGRNVGLVFQFFQLLPMLTVAENVMLPMDFCNTYPGKERRKRALALLDRVGMALQADKLPTTLSGGEQQRVAIARALANDPPILVADEPTGNLDSRTAMDVFDLFQEAVVAGKTVVMVTHDMEFIQRVGRTLRIADGLFVDPDELPSAHAVVKTPFAESESA
jgi:putative ABC transport system ATP-binding protein